MMVQPMREDLTQIGFKEWLTPEDVEADMANAEGTALVVVNSICGCAAGKARPGVATALQNERVPDRLYTVFAGMELEATDRARGYFDPYPPSSPQIALFKDGKLVRMLERSDIEGRGPDEIAGDLTEAFDAHCG
jgi:putative YphP/YqiW family bacilliredoxin